jgi:hypothetical protein
MSWKGSMKIPVAKAIEEHPQIANHLGVLAICKSNPKLFLTRDDPVSDHVNAARDTEK